ncbi:unnamed protein product [Dracunculus medinensis]|uniref:Uncharacterized protein n=1 Tax=Dracunculus medinensis TaxID=318479 RepID=A0A0N4UBW3_DRAME|nr:unnamed protein product [Dracunculus medinensis]
MDLLFFHISKLTLRIIFDWLSVKRNVFTRSAPIIFNSILLLIN